MGFPVGASIGDIDKIQEVANKYVSKAAFRKHDKYAYNKACSLGVCDIVCKHMGNGHTKWTLERLIEEANKYTTIYEFRVNSPKAADAARYHDVYKKITAHMVYENPLAWTSDTIRKIALEYNILKDFRELEPKAYDAAIRLSILEEVTSHMERSRKLWNDSAIVEVANLCETKKEFYTQYNGAYYAAIKRGILDEVCKHMYDKSIPANIDFYDVRGKSGVYFLYLGEELVYVGKSSQDMAVRLAAHKRDHNKVFDKAVAYCITNTTDIAILEAYYIAAEKPMYNIEHSDGQACSFTLPTVAEMATDRFTFNLTVNGGV